MPKVVQLKITLEDIDPAVWRRIQISEGASLRSLKDAINDVMRWSSYHLSVFRISGEQYGDPDRDLGSLGWEDESKLKVAQAVKRSGGMFEYTYDFGDNWVHIIKVENIVEGDPKEKYPLCLAGENAAPLEDCGGPGGFEDLKDFIAGKKKSSEFKNWPPAKGYDPKKFDLDLVNCQIGRRQKLRGI